MRTRYLLVALPIICCLTLAAGVQTAEEKAPTPRPSSPPTLQPMADAVLEQCAKAYSSLESYSGKASILLSFSSGELKERLDADVSFAMSRPNKLAMRLSSKGVSYSLISDGERLWRYLEQQHAFVRAPAPRTIDPLLRGGPLQGAVWQVFGSHPHAALIEGVKTGKYIGEEHEDGRKLHHVRLLQGTTTVDLRVDAETFMIRDLRAVSRDAGSETVLEERHFDVIPDAELDPKTFQFKPPQGAVEVKSFDLGLKDKPLPEVALVNLDGQPVSLGQLRGKVLFIYFRASWAGPYPGEIAALNQLAADYEGKEVVLLTVSVRDELARVVGLSKQLRGNFVVTRDVEGDAARRFGALGFPTLFLADRRGVARKVYYGLPRDLARFQLDLRQELDALLQQPAETPKSGRGVRNK